MDAQAQKNEAARKFGAGLADILSTVAVGVPLGTLADQCVGYLQKQIDANRAALAGDAAARQEARDLAMRAFRKPISVGRLRRGSEATLLRAERGIVPFSGRDAELAEFAEWFDDAEAMRWRLLTGPSGRGKTRFMQHVVETYAETRGDRLLAGFIDLDAIAKTPEALAGFLAHEGEVLLVVDYAERARAQTTAILKLALMLDDAAYAGADLKVRVVLIARGLSEVWQQIGVEHEDIGTVMNSTEGQFDQELPPLAKSPEARRQEFMQAYKAFDREFFPMDSDAGQFPAADEVPNLEPKPPRDDFKEAVMIHLAALAAVLGEVRTVEMTGTRLLDWLINRERREWRRRAGVVLSLEEGVFFEAIDEAMGVITLVATASEEPADDRAVELLRSCPLLRELPLPALLGLGNIVKQLHPGVNGPIGLTPDLLGTYFLGQLPERFFSVVFPEFSEKEATNGLVKLNWLAQSWRGSGDGANPIASHRIVSAINSDPKRMLPLAVDVAQQTGNPIGAISAELIERTNALEVARFLHFAKKLPTGTVSLKEVALAVELTLIRSHQPDGTDSSRAEYVRRANALSSRLANIGRDEEALSIAEDATRTSRMLAAARPDAFTPDLASVLNNLSNRLSALGRWEEALGAAEEAVALYRTLTATRPDAFTPALGAALNTLSNRLSALGRREEALGAVEEAVALRRTLAAARPDAFIPDLAMSLSNLSNRLSDFGRREEALGVVEEAVALYRTLAAARPDAFIPDLASALNNLSNKLSDFGRRDEALGAVEESVSLHRTLAVARPDAFTSELARAVNNLSSRLSSLGRREEALVAVEEAVALYRTLAAARPDVITPRLALALSNLSGELSALGLLEEALGAVEEATSLRCALAAAYPDAFTPDLATSWAVRGEVLMAMARSREARDSFGEFFTLISPILERYPETFAGQTKFNLTKYRQACQASGIAPDMGLIDPLRRAVVDQGFEDPFADDEDPSTPPDTP